MLKLTFRRVLWLGVFALVTAILVVIVVPFASYLYAMNEYSKCGPRQWHSRREVESCLTFYVTGDCEEQPLSVRGVRRDPASVCVNYKILGVEPIYAIYDPQGAIQGWYEVYE